MISPRRLLPLTGSSEPRFIPQYFLRFQSWFSNTNANGLLGLKVTISPSQLLTLTLISDSWNKTFTSHRKLKIVAQHIRNLTSFFTLNLLYQCFSTGVPWNFLGVPPNLKIHWVFTFFPFANLRCCNIKTILISMKWSTLIEKNTKN